MRYGEVRGRPEDFEAFAEPPAPPVPRLPRKINLEPEKVERGLVQLVLSLLELIRQLVEKQALRRVEGGSLTAAQAERVGATLLELEQKMAELKEHFEIDSLNLDLGPLGNLLDDEAPAKSPPLRPARPPGFGRGLEASRRDE
ncbi:MAG: gas vesicle protein K [Deltaproteobacteria bacterium]|nr:gas vesicle protein K [Deltaproteobacteria bacterium]